MTIGWSDWHWWVTLFAHRPFDILRRDEAIFLWNGYRSVPWYVLQQQAQSFRQCEVDIFQRYATGLEDIYSWSLFRTLRLMKRQVCTANPSQISSRNCSEPSEDWHYIGLVSCSRASRRLTIILTFLPR